MKKLAVKKYIHHIPALFAAGMLLFFMFSACTDKNGVGMPVIDHVRSTNPAAADSFFTSAFPGSTILIQGSNFTGLQHIYINNVEMYVNPAFVTDHNIVLEIPAEVPTAATDPNVTNTLRLVTNTGEVVYNFVMSVNPPVITRISNEMAKPGDSIYIYGTNLYVVDSVVFPGNVGVTSGFVVNDAATVLGTVVPEGATGSGVIALSNMFGRAVANEPFNDKTGMVCNFDDLNNFSWGCNIVTDNGTFPGADGQFANMSFTDVGANDFSWWNGGRSINLNSAVLIDPNDAAGASLDDYGIRFEMFAAEPWNSGELFLLFNYDWTYVSRFNPWKINNKRTNFKSTFWQTVTIPLSTFLTKANNLDGTGTPASGLTQLLGSGLNNSLNIFLINSSTDESNPDIQSKLISSFNLGIDNIRLVKIK